MLGAKKHFCKMLCTSSGWMPSSWLQSYLNITQAPNTFDRNRNVMRFNLRIFTRISAAWNRQKNNISQPRLENKYIVIKKKVYIKDWIYENHAVDVKFLLLHQVSYRTWFHDSVRPGYHAKPYAKWLKDR